jgi:hypothetical protein
MQAPTLLQILLLSCLLAPGLAGATALTSVTIEPAHEPGEFNASASVRELATDRLIAAPRLAVRAGETREATVGVPQDGVSVRLEITIDATATRAGWRLEWRRADRLEAATEGSVTLARAEESGY